MHRFTSISDRPARFEAAGLVALCAAVAVLAWWLLAPEAVMRLMDESGPIEETTAVLYFLVAAYVLVAGVPQAEPSLPLPLCVVLCGFGARELDLHKAFTETSVLKLSFYLGDAPLAHKLVAAVVVLAVLASLLHLLVRHGRTVWRGLRQGQPSRWWPPRSSTGRAWCCSRTSALPSAPRPRPSSSRWKRRWSSACR